ncbi:hypothetical protein ABT124_43750 [Streptomyces sp. NPDC001982]|uniref:hypothetical protein n=1 Tax=Streptomyces sp. NPDC001982 TaxID=3154405 RepID=UPI0033200046
MVQFTPPGSSCSIIFGTGVSSAAPGSAQGLYLVVSNIDEARTELSDATRARASRAVTPAKRLRPGPRPTRPRQERQHKEMTQQFAGETTLVHAGGSSIGRAPVYALAAEGAPVTVSGRTAVTRKGSVRPREAAGVTDDSRVERAIQAATAEAGRLGFSLINAAGGGTFRVGRVHCTDVLSSVIVLHVPGVFLSNGQHRGRVAAAGLPDLWRPGRGQHRRPAVPNGSGRQQ